MPEFTQDWFTQHIPNFDRFLSQLAGKKASALEIGSFEGRSAMWGLENILTHPESHMTCVDLMHDDYRDRLVGNLSPFGDKVTLIGKQSEVALSELVVSGAEFDFIYVDGLHQHYLPLHDLVLSHQMLKHGGIVAADDYLLMNDACGRVTVNRCVNAFMMCYGDHYEILHQEFQVWLKRK